MSTNLQHSRHTYESDAITCQCQYKGRGCHFQIKIEQSIALYHTFIQVILIMNKTTTQLPVDSIYYTALYTEVCSFKSVSRHAT